jgi:PadR family transcriptional regulator
MVRLLRLGEFEHLLMLAILRLGPDAYGVAIAREIGVRTGRRPAPGAVYTALDRLDRRGLVESWMGAPTAERGGRRKRFYRVTATGAVALRRRHEALAEMTRGLTAEPEAQR